jgi:DNA-binding IclR family transcriptional regulator
VVPLLVTDMSQDSLVPALDRALLLLREIASAPEPLTLSELSERIGVSRSSVFNLLATLQLHGMVEKNARYKTYLLGVSIFELGHAYLDQVSLIPAFNQEAQRIVQRCQETVKLAVLEGRDVVYLGKQEGLYSVRLVARVGSRVPAHMTAVGKVLLSELAGEELNSLYQDYDFPLRTARTIRSLDGLHAELRQVRSRGFAYDREESSVGLTCVAAPIRDHSQQIIAAISIGVPNERLAGNRLDELRLMLMTAAQELSRTLGAGRK